MHAIFKIREYHRCGDKLPSVPSRKKGWGGRRAGSGRKQAVEDPVRLAIDVEREDLDELRVQAENKGISMAEHIRRLLARAARRTR